MVGSGQNPSMGFRELASDRQPQTSAPLCAAAAPIGAIKALKDKLQGIFWNPWSAVMDR
jgi:hypothetical protein